MSGAPALLAPILDIPHDVFIYTLSAQLSPTDTMALLMACKALYRRSERVWQFRLSADFGVEGIPGRECRRRYMDMCGGAWVEERYRAPEDETILRAMEAGEPDVHFKITIMGSPRTGKSSLLLVFQGEPCPQDYTPTVFDNYIVEREFGPHAVDFDLWDTAGKEDYDRLRPLSCPSTDIFLLVFSLDSPESLEAVKSKWYPEMSHFAPGLPWLLVGLKSDLKDSTPTPATGGRLLARQSNNCTAYVECSPLSGLGVDRLFDLVLKVGELPCFY